MTKGPYTLGREEREGFGGSDVGDWRALQFEMTEGVYCFWVLVGQVD